MITFIQQHSLTLETLDKQGARLAQVAASLLPFFCGQHSHLRPRIPEGIELDSAGSLNPPRQSLHWPLLRSAAHMETTVSIGSFATSAGVA
jgi:predicted DNA-binding transcriptional regulator YafY